MRKKRSQHIASVLLFTGTAISLLFGPWLLVKAWILPIPDTLQEQLDQAVGHGFERIVVYIDQAGKPAQHLASGWHNRESRIPAKPKAILKIASISKLYDAVAVTKSVSQEQLSLDKTIADYLPEQPTLNL